VKRDKASACRRLWAWFASAGPTARLSERWLNRTKSTLAEGQEGSVLTVSVGASLVQIAARTMEARE